MENEKPDQGAPARECLAGPLFSMREPWYYLVVSAGEGEAVVLAVVLDSVAARPLSSEDLVASFVADSPLS